MSIPAPDAAVRSPVFLNRVILQNYKSIAKCDVRLSALTYLVGGNGSGKSNFLDALHLVRDALDNALNERGGLAEVRRISGGHPTHFGIRLEFTLPDATRGLYAFKIGALAGGNYEVQSEKCVIGGPGQGPSFELERGQLKSHSEDSFPAVAADRLALVSASGLKAFRPVYDALTAMGLYNISPKLIRDLQKPQDGKLLRPTGENIASVIAHLERTSPQALQLIERYLEIVVPTIHKVEREPVGPMETLSFRQDVAGAKKPWRALGVLTALFQHSAERAPTLVGIEEPETALHPAASAALREALRRAAQQTQVLVTSHSPDLLDDPSISPESVRAVVAANGDTKIAPLDEASTKMLKDQLFTAGELLRLNQLAQTRQRSSARSSAHTIYSPIWHLHDRRANRRGTRRGSCGARAVAQVGAVGHAGNSSHHRSSHPRKPRQVPQQGRGVPPDPAAGWQQVRRFRVGPDLAGCR
jgi:predicted ATPase